MNEWKLVDESTGNVKHFDSRSEAEERKDDMEGLTEGPLTIEHIDGESDTDAEVVDAVDSENTAPTMDTDGKAEQNAATHTEDFDLPDEQPGVDTDPLEWVPGDFIDHIDGTPAINRKGYDVIAHHFNISVTTDVLVSPSETDFTYAEVVATAETEDGVVYKAHGSAHVDRGDDSYLLLEMADTRAAKRATARATGVGMVAVQELQNDL